MKKTYVHLDQFLRDRVQALFEQGHKKAAIARIVGVDKSTITREIKRNCRKIRQKGGTRDGPYLAEIEYILNHKPRKSLGYATPHEVMQTHHLLTPIKNTRVALRG